MNLSLLSYIFLFILTLTQSFSCTTDQYNKFLKSFQLSPPQTQSQYDKRFIIYCQNLQLIQNQNSQNNSYKAKQYRWMDYTQDEIKNFIRLDVNIQHMYQAFKVDQSEISNISTYVKSNANEYRSVRAPAQLDYRTTNQVSSVKDQGTCGSCWVFASVGLYESWLMVKGQRQYDLSQQYILECTTLYAKNILGDRSTSDCKSGMLNHAGDLLRVNGAPLQTTYPYKAQNYSGSGFQKTDGICEANLTYVFGGDPSVTTFQAWNNLTNPDLKQLLTQGPVSAAMYAPISLLSYSSGIYTDCSSTSFWTSYFSLNHAVVIVGYDVNGNYIIKNSWGSRWGQNGFGVISKDRDCGLSSFVFKYFSRSSGGRPMNYTPQLKLKSGYNNQYSMFLVIAFSLMMILM